MGITQDNIPSTIDLASNDQYKLIWIWWAIGTVVSTWTLFHWALLFRDHWKVEVSNPNVRRLVLRMFILLPVMVGCAYTSMIVPRITVLMCTIIDISIAFYSLSFLHLTVAVFGGEAKAIDQASSLHPAQYYKNLPLTCCCGLCLPSKPFRHWDFLFCKACVIQVCIVKPGLTILSLALVIVGEYNQNMDFGQAYPFIKVFSVVSGLLATWGFNVIATVFGDTFPEKNLSVKFRTSNILVLGPPLISLTISVLVKVGAFGWDSSGLPADTKVILWENFLTLFLAYGLLLLFQRYWTVKDYTSMAPNNNEREDSPFIESQQEDDVHSFDEGPE